MSYFSGLISTIFERRYQKALSNEADARTTPQLCEALLSSHGEVSGATLAHTLLDRYAGMSPAEKVAFFQYMTMSSRLALTPSCARLRPIRPNPAKAHIVPLPQPASQSVKSWRGA